ncbi:hypothetical protein D3C75_1226740 [compost metagenome]
MRASTLASSGTGGWWDKPPEARNSTRLFSESAHWPMASPSRRARLKLGKGTATELMNTGITGQPCKPPSNNSKGWANA